MSEQAYIPENIKRLIIRSIDSVPHLEVLLMLHREPNREWTAKTMAQRLFIHLQKIEQALSDLSALGFASVKNSLNPFYHYNPSSPELKETIDQLAEIYPRNIIEITNLIHSKINKQAQQFGDAFKWQKDKD